MLIDTLIDGRAARHVETIFRVDLFIPGAIIVAVHALGGEAGIRRQKHGKGRGQFECLAGLYDLSA